MPRRKEKTKIKDQEPEWYWTTKEQNWKLEGIRVILEQFWVKMIFNLEFYTHLKYHIIVGVEQDKFRYVKSQKNVRCSSPFSGSYYRIGCWEWGSKLWRKIMGTQGQGIKSPTQEAGRGNFQDESKDKSYNNSCKTDLGSSQH